MNIPSIQSRVAELVQLPDVNEILRELEQAMNAESEKRTAFYKTAIEREGEKLEFINGQMIVASPAKKYHIASIGNLYKLCDAFVDKHDLGFVGFEKTMIQLERNDFEPDLCFFRKEVADTFTDDLLFFPKPDFVVEILSDSTAHRDRGVKFRAYEYNQIPEYWIIDGQAKFVEQYVLVDEKYELRLKSDSGDIKSIAIPDFHIPITAIFNKEENLKTLLAILQAE